MKVSWMEPAEMKVSWTGPAEAKVSWTGPAEAKVSWTEPTLGGALEALNLVIALIQRNALEAQTLGRARVALTLVGTQLVLSLWGALEALNWTVPAGTKVRWMGPAEAKVSWTGLAEAKVSWTGFRLGIGDFPDIGLPSLANSGWKSLGAPQVDGMRSQAGTGS